MHANLIVYKYEAYSDNHTQLLVDLRKVDVYLPKCLLIRLCYLIYLIYVYDSFAFGLYLSISLSLNIFDIICLGFVKHKNLGINEWEIFINASNIHPQISATHTLVISTFE